MPCDEHKFDGTEERLHKIESNENFWEKAYSELNIKEALEKAFKEMDKEDN